MKIIAFYLPQFHCIPENDEWWGRGFTEWVNVKAARPLFKGHEQPRVPLHDNYYNLLDLRTLRWQIGLAKKYGIYGFCFYHYWFGGRKLLEKPMELMRDSAGLNIPYCICWANENWTNAWKADRSRKTLIQQTYGGKEEWKEHFAYLLTFFRDRNYMLEDNKPILVIYRPELIPRMNEMLDYWDSLAKRHGFGGMVFAYQQLSFHILPGRDESRFQYNIEYQPGYARYDMQIAPDRRAAGRAAFKMRTKLRNACLKVDKALHTDFTPYLTRRTLQTEDYDALCARIVDKKPDSPKAVPGMFTGWDNTPRMGKRGRVCLGSSPEKFGYYLKKQIQNAAVNYKKDMIFIFAWNEWAEGGYLEPDKKHGYAYLEAVRNALEENKW